jgi:hypothetical protein
MVTIMVTLRNFEVIINKFKKLGMFKVTAGAFIVCASYMSV